MARNDLKHMIDYRIKRSDHFWQPAITEPVAGEELPERLRQVQQQHGANYEYRTRVVTADCPDVAAAGFCGRPH